MRQIHHNLLLRENLSRVIVKVTQVRGTAPVLIPQSRAYRAGIEMRSSLFNYKKKTKPKTTSIVAHPYNGGLRYFT